MPPSSSSSSGKLGWETDRKVFQVHVKQGVECQAVFLYATVCSITEDCGLNYGESKGLKPKFLDQKASSLV